MAPSSNGRTLDSRSGDAGSSPAGATIENEHTRDAIIPDSLIRVPQKLEDVILREILNALAVTGNNQAAAARCLGITERVMHYQMKKFNIRTKRQNKD